MPNPDLHPAADRLAAVLHAVPDGALDAPTPCDIPLGAVIDHVGQFARVFQATARKELGEATASPPTPATANLEPGWRDRIAADLAALADAWDEPDAWDGMTQAGGIDLPGPVAGRVGLDELVVHGWDIARATGQPYDCDDATVQEIEGTIAQLRNGHDGDMPGLFGAVVPVPDGAPLLHKVLGLTGRNPDWSPT